jgi:hypothetical protein
MRPAVLEKVEHQLWRMVLSIAAGESLDNELEKFMSSVSMILKKVDKEAMQPRWFIGGMMLTIPLLMSN